MDLTYFDRDINDVLLLCSILDKDKLYFWEVNLQIHLFVFPEVGICVMLRHARNVCKQSVLITDTLKKQNNTNVLAQYIVSKLSDVEV